MPMVLLMDESFRSQSQTDTTLNYRWWLLVVHQLRRSNQVKYSRTRFSGCNLVPVSVQEARLHNNNIIVGGGRAP